MANIHEGTKVSSIETNTFKAGKAAASVLPKMRNKMSSPVNKRKSGGINRKPGSN